MQVNKGRLPGVLVIVVVQGIGGIQPLHEELPCHGAPGLGQEEQGQGGAAPCHPETGRTDPGWDTREREVMKTGWPGLVVFNVVVTGGEVEKT